jgi:hypothetical protein
MPSTPISALDQLRRKQELVANEFSQGKINRAQFNAVYGRYSEQRAIIERLMARNQNSDAWKQVATPGHTGFLRHHFESLAVYFLVFRHRHPQPLLIAGKEKPDVEAIRPVLKAVQNLDDQPRAGLARKSLGENRWLVLAAGELAITLVVFSLEPSNSQITLARDLHQDFERANRMLLVRGPLTPEQMVFPQRALVEQHL